MSSTARLGLAAAIAGLLPLAALADHHEEGHSPYGRPHPEAAGSLSDFAFAIGRWSCDSSLAGQETETLTWEFRYILDGRAVQDVFEAPSVTGMGIRQPNPQDGKWHVAYHSMYPGYANAMWVGEKEEDRIVLHRTVAGPDGNEMDIRLQFYNISENGFEWSGENVVGEEATRFWHIVCDERLG